MTNHREDGSVVGFIGLGDQGLPMATAIAEAGFELHVWARRPISLHALDDTPHVAANGVTDLAASCDIIALCVATDEDVLALVDQMMPALRPGTILINHGTGTPEAARRIEERVADRDVKTLDAPVSGGRPAARARTLTVFAGGPEDALRRAERVLRSYSTNMVHLGGTGAGQLAKLCNNALLMLNQAAIADILDLAERAGADPGTTVEAMRLGSGNSAALGLFGTMITAATVDHLSAVETLDMDLFESAMRKVSVDAAAVTARGLSGAQRLHRVIDQLTSVDPTGD